ncbi:MAG TPA: response regulator [Flavisolibacter sp.]|nr:response regulator [Flavisolibacter sp.]
MRHPLTCFLIDNDEEDQEIFSMALREADPAVQCTFVNNGPAALEKFATEPSFIPSVIFVDMNMPLMSGAQCLEEIKKLPHLRKVPVYMYSTAADPLAVAAVKELGAQDFIVKPASFKELTEILSRILHHHKTFSL